MVFTDVLNVGRLDMDGQSCAPIGLHKTDGASGWLLKKGQGIATIGLPGVQLQTISDYIRYRRDFSIYWKDDVLCRLKIRGASEKFKTSSGTY
jgi:hypothetical protein